MPSSAEKDSCYSLWLRNGPLCIYQGELYFSVATSRSAVYFVWPSCPNLWLESGQPPCILSGSPAPLWGPPAAVLRRRGHRCSWRRHPRCSVYRLPRLVHRARKQAQRGSVWCRRLKQSRNPLPIEAVILDVLDQRCSNQGRMN